jgi:hypothetical protein
MKAVCCETHTKLINALTVGKTQSFLMLQDVVHILTNVV